MKNRTCILHNARISSVDSIMFVNRIRKMLSFEFSKEIEKDIFFILSQVKGQRKNFIALLTIESLCLSGRASEHEIWRSEVRFLMRTQNFFFVPS